MEENKDLPATQKESDVGFREMFPLKKGGGQSIRVPISAENFQENIDFKRFSKTIVRRLWVCIASAIVMGLVGFFVLDPVFNDDESYTASTHLLYKEYKRDDGSFSVNTVKDMIVMKQNCQAVKTVMNVDLSVDDIQRMSTVTVNRKSNFLVLSTTAKEADLARDIANTLGEMAVKNNLAFYRQKAENSRNSFRTQADAARLKAKEADAALVKFQSESGIVDMEITRRRLIESIANLEEKFKESDNQVTARKVELKAIQEELKITPKEISRSVQKQDFLVFEYQALKRKYIQLVAEYGDKNPKVLKVKEELDEIKKTIDLAEDENKDVLKEKNPQFSALKLKETEIQINLDKAVKINASVEKSLKEKQSFIQRLPELQIIFNRLLQEKKDADLLVETLDLKAREAELEYRSPKADFEVYESAREVTENRKVPKHFFTMVSTAFGGSLSFLIILLAGVLDRKIVTRKELESYYKAPCLAEIPTMHEAEMKMIDSPFSLYVQNMAEKMAQSIDGQGSQVISFTSTYGKEGKTAIINELTKYYSKLGLKSVYMNFDHRDNDFFENTMDVNNFLGSESGHFDDLLATHDNITEAKFDFSDGMRERVKSLGSQKLLSHLRDEYNIILLDSPGILEKDYSCNVNSIADHVVYVIRSGQDKKSDVDKALILLEDRGIVPLGMILNDVSSEYLERT